MNVIAAIIYAAELALAAIILFYVVEMLTTRRDRTRSAPLMAFALRVKVRKREQGPPAERWWARTINRQPPLCCSGT